MQSIRAFFRSLFRKIRNFFTGKGWTDDSGVGEIVDYYGCPNSHKAKALQLRRKTIR